MLKEKFHFAAVSSHFAFYRRHKHTHSVLFHLYTISIIYSSIVLLIKVHCDKVYSEHIYILQVIYQEKHKSSYFVLLPVGKKERKLNKREGENELHY